MLLTLHEPIPSAVSSFINDLAQGKPSAYITIIAALAAIAAILALVLIFRKKAEKPSAVPAETIAVSETPAPAEDESPASDDSAIVAAIVAAISAHTGKAPTAFRVVSFKRRH